MNKPFLIEEDYDYFDDFKPSWLLHPIERYRYNMWMKNIAIASKVIEDYEDLDKLALLTEYDIANMNLTITYSRDKSGDYLKYRGKYIITPYSNFTNVNNIERFKEVIFKVS